MNTEVSLEFISAVSVVLSLLTGFVSGILYAVKKKYKALEDVATTYKNLDAQRHNLLTSYKEGYEKLAVAYEELHKQYSFLLNEYKSQKEMNSVVIKKH